MASTNQFDVITYIMAKKYADRVGMYINPLHNFADDTARNVYFAANTTEVVLGMYIIEDGALLKLLEIDYSDNDSWQDISPIIKGDKGDTGVDGEGVAPGGTAGQVLAKATEADYDTEWVTPAAADVTYNNAVSGLTADDVQDAIDEVVGDIGDVDGDLDDHVDNTTTAHGAVSAATASKIIIRDANGRAKIADPSASDDIANLGTVQGFKNLIINGNFAINQRGHTSGGTLAAAAYGHDRWKAGAGGCNYTFAASGGKVTVTIPADKELLQIIEGTFLQSGTYTLSWEGTAQAKIGAGSYANSPITASVTGGANLTITFGAGTLANVQFERGEVATPFEQRPIGLELSLCQRYYQGDVAPSIAGVYRITGIATSTTGAVVHANLQATMRVAPTVVVYDSSGNANRVFIVGVGNHAGVIAVSLPSAGGIVAINTNSTWTVGQGIIGGYTADAEM